MVEGFAGEDRPVRFQVFRSHITSNKVANRCCRGEQFCKHYGQLVYPVGGLMDIVGEGEDEIELVPSENNMRSCNGCKKSTNRTQQQATRDFLAPSLVLRRPY